VSPTTVDPREFDTILSVFDLSFQSETSNVPMMKLRIIQLLSLAIRLLSRSVEVKEPLTKSHLQARAYEIQQFENASSRL
jgi:hypothetical protein